MLFGRPVCFAALTVSLLAYGLDCVGMTTPEQAMQCCKSMGCHSHNVRGQDCCKSMPAQVTAVAQPPSVQAHFFSPCVVGIVSLVNFQVSYFSAGRIGQCSHDPPQSASVPVLPLRV